MQQEYNSIVMLKSNNIFTDSKVIAEGIGNKHHTITKLIRNYSSQIESLGKVGFKIHASRSGQKTKVYTLNEAQATFLMTLFRNTPVIINFKLKLTQEFYRMRMVLMQRQSAEWLLTRNNGKRIRKGLTAVFAELVEYARKQGSEHPKVIYLSYTRMIHSFVGIKSGGRQNANIETLTTLAFIENVIMITIKEEMQRGTYFKDIYKFCKAKSEQIAGLAFLSTTKLLVANLN